MEAKPLPAIGIAVSLWTMVMLGQFSRCGVRYWYSASSSRPQEFERPVGEHHAEAPGRVARAAIEDRDVVRRVETLHQRREVEARGARTEDPDLHGSVTQERESEPIMAHAAQIRR